MGSGPSVYAESVCFIPSSPHITAEDNANIKFTIKHDPVEIKEVTCFSKHSFAMSERDDRFRILIEGAGVIRIGITTKDPRTSDDFIRDPFFEHEDGFDSSRSELELYYERFSGMVCYGPLGSFMEYSPKITKETEEPSSAKYLYVVFIYGKPKVSITYKKAAVDWAHAEQSNIKIDDRNRVTLSHVQNISTLQLKKKIDFNRGYHINWDMQLSNEQFGNQSPTFGFMRLRLVTSGFEDLQRCSLNAADQPEDDTDTVWLASSAVAQYPYSGTIGLNVTAREVCHNLMVSSVGDVVMEGITINPANKPVYLVMEASSGSFEIQSHKYYVPRQSPGSIFFVNEHDEFDNLQSARFTISNEVGHDPYRIQYGPNPKSFMVMFNKRFTRSDEIRFKRLFNESESLSETDTVQLLFKSGHLDKHKLEETFSRHQLTGGGEINRITEIESLSGSANKKFACWTIQYKSITDARRVWKRQTLRIDGVEVYILPWYDQLGEALNFGDKPAFDETDLIMSDIDQDKLGFVQWESWLEKARQTRGKPAEDFIRASLLVGNFIIGNIGFAKLIPCESSRERMTLNISVEKCKQQRFVLNSEKEQDQLKQHVDKFVPVSILYSITREWIGPTEDKPSITIQLRTHTTLDFKIRACWKGIVITVVNSYFDKILVKTVSVGSGVYDSVIRRLREQKGADLNFSFKGNRQEFEIKLITSDENRLADLLQLCGNRPDAGRQTCVLEKGIVDIYRALDEEGVLQEVQEECQNTRFMITQDGVKLTGPKQEIQKANSRILELATNTIEIQEKLTVGQEMVLKSENGRRCLEKKLKNENLCSHFRVENRFCKLFIYVRRTGDREEKRKISTFKSCIDSIFIEKTVPITNEMLEILKKKPIEDIIRQLDQTDPVHVEIDDKAKEIKISGTENSVIQTEQLLKQYLYEEPMTTKHVILSFDVLEYIAAWSDTFQRYPYTLIESGSNSPVKIKITATKKDMQKLTKDLMAEARGISSRWFRISRPWLAVKRHEVSEVSEHFIKQNRCTVDIEATPSLIDRNVSCVALENATGTTCLSLCCDITKSVVDSVIVPVYSSSLEMTKGLAGKVAKAGGKSLSTICNEHIYEHGQLKVAEPVILAPGDLPCQMVIFVYLPSKGDEFDKILVQALNASLQVAGKMLFSSVLVPVMLFSSQTGVDKYMDDVVKVIDEFVLKNPKGTVKEIGLCDTKLGVVDKVQKSMSATLKGSWSVYSHGQRIKEPDVALVRPLSAQGKTVLHGPRPNFWGNNEHRLQLVNDKDGDDQDEEAKEIEHHRNRPLPIIEEFSRGLPFNIQLTENVLIQIKKGKIEDEDTDVIVNPTPVFPQLAGAVSNALLKAGGDSIRTECQQHGPVSAGKVTITKAGKLKCKRLYHILQPMSWEQDRGFEVVQNMVSECLLQADMHKETSITFPAIGTGASHFPADKVAEAMLEAVFDFSDTLSETSVKTVNIVLYYMDSHTIKVFEDSVPKLVCSKTGEESTVKRSDKEASTLQLDKTDLAIKGQMKKFIFLSSKRQAQHTDADDLLFMKLTLKGDVKAAVKRFEESIDAKFVKENVKYTFPDLTSSEIQRIKELESRYCVRVTVDEKKSSIILYGFKREVEDAKTKIYEFLRLDFPTERDKKRMQEDVLKYVEWFYYDNDNLLSYDEVSNFEIHFAYLEGKDFVYNNTKENVRYQVLVQTLEEHPVTDSTKKRRMVMKQRVSQGIEIPDTWSIKGSSDSQALVTLDPSSSEYNEVKQKFIKDGCPFTGIVNIKRVEDRYKYLQYMSKMKQLESQNGSDVQNERRLWHGTDADTVTKILKNGYDRSFAGAHATRHGHGVYFATTSRYSHGYTQADAANTRHMFLNQVLVGKYCQSDPQMKVLPERQPINNVKILYDSSVDKLNNPSMFIIFHDTQAYPQYLIEYN